MNQYPRVLIFGQTFNDFSGGGITLSNLFKEWPVDSLAVVSYPFMLHNTTTDICRNYYQIGLEELKWKFPFSRIKQQFPSGKLTPESKRKIPILQETRHVRHSFSKNILTPILKWTGLVHCISSIHLSQKMKEWLSGLAPDILYFQISNRESVNFAVELIDYLKIPSVIHMMDDWPSTISGSGLFSTYWRRRIDCEFRSLLDKTDLHLSISDAMSDEYYNRYGKYFRAFHNPIDPERFSIELPSKRPDDKKFKILYIGRIGTANRSSLLQFATFISGYDTDGLSIEFNIYTKDHNSSYAVKLGKLKRVTVREAVNHSEVPLLLISSDLLLLPLDFTGSGLRFSKLSMPTKASEYMMSGTPILVFAPEYTAISKLCRRYGCGHCVTSTDSKKIAESMNMLVHDMDFRNGLRTNALNLAVRLFDVHIVREEFTRLLSDLTETLGRN